MSHKISKLQILQMTLTNNMEELNIDYLLRWLDSLPDDFHFCSVEDLVIAFIGYESDPNAFNENADWRTIQEIWKSVYEPDVHLEDEELVVESNHVEIMRIPVPNWILELDGLISFLNGARDRIPTARELKELLVSIWFPQFC